MVARINAQLPWLCLQGSGGNWVAKCDPLGLTVQEETWAELMEAIGETLDAVFKDLLASNDLLTFLERHGWSLVGEVPTRPEDVQRFDVPFIPTMVGSDGFQTGIRQ